MMPMKAAAASPPAADEAELSGTEVAAHDGAPASARDADVGSENEENEPNEPEEMSTEMWGNKADEEEEAAAECEGGRAFEKTVCPSCNQPVWPDSPLPEPEWTNSQAQGWWTMVKRRRVFEQGRRAAEDARAQREDGAR